MFRKALFALVASNLAATSAWASVTCADGSYADLSGFEALIQGGVTTNSGSFTSTTGMIICSNGTYTNALGADFDNNSQPVRIAPTTASGGMLNNYGMFAVSATAGFGGGTINNYATGVIKSADNATYYGGAINNWGKFSSDATSRFTSGNFTNHAGGTLDLYGQSDNYGMIDNAGTLTNHVYGSGIFITGFKSGLFNNGGAIDNQAGGVLTNGGVMVNTGTINNHGTLNAYTEGGSGGWIQNTTGTLTNYADGTIRVGNGLLHPQFMSSNTFSNQGNITVASGAGLYNGQYTYIDPNTYVPRPTSTGNFTNSGDITINSGGTFGNSSAIFTDSGAVANAGAITNSGTFAVTATGSVSGTGIFTQTAGTTTVDGSLSQSAIAINGGLLKGDGTVSGAVSVGGGTVAPGHSPGLLTFTNNLAIQSGGVSIELGGTARGTEYSAIDAGNITLGGTLSVTLVDIGSGIFAPQAGNKFDIMEAASISGSFSSLAFAPLAGGLTWTYGIVAMGNGRQAYELGVVADPVPEADIDAMMLAGLGLVGFVAGRRRSSVQ